MDDEFIDPNELYESGEGDTSTGSGEEIEGSKGLYRTVGYLLGVVVLAFVGFVCFDSSFFFKDKTDPTVPESKIDQTVAGNLPGQDPSSVENSEFSGVINDKVKEITGLDVPKSANLNWQKQEEIAANQAAIEAVRSKLQEISKRSAENLEQIIEVRSTVAELRSSEAGARIASNEKFVQQFIGLEEIVSEFDASVPGADGFYKDISALLDRVSAAKETNYAPKPFVFDRAEDFLEKLNTKAKEIEKYANAVNYLIEETRLLPAGQMLESAVAKRIQNEASELADHLANIRTQAQEKNKQLLTKAEENRIATEGELAAAKINILAEQNADQKDEILAKAAKEKLEKEFARDLDSVNSYLLPFISEGRNLRGNATGKGPASFSEIKMKGALENTVSGLSSLSNVASNGRQFGGFPLRMTASMITRSSTEGDIFGTAQNRSSVVYLEKAQSLLVKYGELMVEKGMLAE